MEKYNIEKIWITDDGGVIVATSQDCSFIPTLIVEGRDFFEVDAK